MIHQLISVQMTDLHVLLRCLPSWTSLSALRQRGVAPRAFLIFTFSTTPVSSHPVRNRERFGGTERPATVALFEPSEIHPDPDRSRGGKSADQARR